MIDWLVETGIAVTALMLAVLAVRRPVAALFGAGWAYALWLLPAFRLVLPPLHLFGEVPSLFSAAAPAPPAAAAVPTPAGSDAIAWEPALLAIWVAGALAFAIWQAASYLAFLRRLGIGSQVQASLAQDVGIVESTEVDGPLAIGLLDKWIIVPANFATRYSPEEQRLALLHERVHHQREDIFCNMLALGVLALNWFNPVAYAAFRAFRADQELSCDAAVAARASGAERHDYARALVKSASKPGLIAACPLNHAGQLKRRLRMMKAHRQSRLRAAGGSAAVVALLLAGISVTESRGVAAPEVLPPVRATGPVHVEPTPAPAADRRAEAAVKAPVKKAKAVVAPRPAAPLERTAAPTAPAKDVPVASAEPEAPPPHPTHVVVRVSEASPYAFAALQSLPLRQVRIVRHEVRTVGELPAELQAKLEKLIARRDRLRAVTEFHTVRSIQDQEN